jgi:hypothetical protein
MARQCASISIRHSPVGVMLNVMHTIQRFCYRRFSAALRKITDGIIVLIDTPVYCHPMKKSDVTCPECSAGYRRIELTSKPGAKGEILLLVCNHLLEVFDGTKGVALRLKVQPEKWFE